MARTVFKWTLGGNKVFIAGSFNGWKQVEMEQQGDEFSIVLVSHFYFYYYHYMLTTATIIYTKNTINVKKIKK